jgi:hypothetical protein
MLSRFLEIPISKYHLKLIVKDKGLPQQSEVAPRGSG